VAKRRASNEGSIFKRMVKGRLLWVGEIDLSVESGGTRKRRTVYGRTQKEVREKLDALKVKRRRHVNLDAGQRKIAICLSEWLAEKAESRRQRTIEDYEDLAERLIVPHLGKKRIEVLSPADIRGWHRALKKQGVGARSAQKAHGLLRQMLDCAVKDRSIDYNPARSVDRPAYKPERRPTLQPDEVRKLLDQAQGHRLEGMIVLAVLHGLRFGEAAALRWRDVDFRGSCLHVVHTLVEGRDGSHTLGKPKSEAGERTVPLSKLALDVLRGHRTALRALPHPDALIFTEVQGGPLRRSNFNRTVWAPLIADAGLTTVEVRGQPRKLHFHDLRHSFVSTLIACGIDVATISEVVGHADVEVTHRIYAHALKQQVTATADRIDELFGRN